MPLPSEKEEVWRYSPIDDLDLDAYVPAAEPLDALGPEAEAFVASWLAAVGGAGAQVVVHNGGLVSVARQSCR